MLFYNCSVFICSTVGRNSEINLTVIVFSGFCVRIGVILCTDKPINEQTE